MSSSVGLKYHTTKRVALNANLDLREFPFGKPRRIRVTNETTLCRAEWNDQMPDAAGWKTVAAGDLTYVTSLGFTPLDGDSTHAPGIRLGAMVDINDTLTEVLFIEAWG